MKKRIIKKLKRRVCKKFNKKDKNFNEIMRKVTQNIMQVGSRMYKQKFTETILALAIIESPFDKVSLNQLIDEEYINMKKQWGRRTFSNPIEDAEEYVSCWNS